jgi:hypothetical protein
MPPSRPLRSVIAMLVVGLLAALSSAAIAADGLTITTGPSGMYYDTPDNEVAYNAQIFKRADWGTWVNVYHGEPRNLPTMSNGDSVKTAYATAWAYTLPAPRHYALWAANADQGGPANPMLIRGQDGYNYIFFIRASGDRHYLAAARTAAFADMQLLTAQGWQTNTGQLPAIINDAQGNPIRSNNAMTFSQGLIGSMAYVNGQYYYFYTDCPPGDTSQFRLYYRTSADLASWSAAAQVSPEALAVGALVDVQKGFMLDRWAVVYTCYSSTGAGSLCVQYATDLSIASLAALTLYDLPGTARSSHALSFPGANFSQPGLMTDGYGNLLAPPNAPQDCTGGGLVTWMDLSSGTPWGAPVHWGRWSVTDCALTPTATRTPAPTPTATPFLTMMIECRGTPLKCEIRP